MPAHRADRRSAPTRADAFYYRDRDSGSRLTGSWISETTELDAGLYERQMAGIAALFAITTDVVTVTRTGQLKKLVEESETKQGRLRILWTRLQEDPMMWNSLYLVLTTALMAGFGFAFWIITAHLFSVTDVGKASGLVSASGVIGNLAILGLNNGLNKYLPESKNPDRMINSGMALVGTAGAMGSLIYLLLVPLIAPDLSFVDSPLLAFGFVLITAAQAVNTLTDTIFVATRNAKYTAFVDGIVGGVGKIVCAFLLIGGGTYGLYVASASGFVLASVASLLLIYLAMQIRFDLRKPLQTLKPLLGFAGANYVGNIFNMIPALVVPLILLDRLGPKSAAYFFVVFQIVQIVYAAALALEQTFLAEGSRADADMRALRRRSVRMLVMFCVPTALGIIGIGRFLLLAFGGAYASNGFISLVILCLAAGPIAANYWFLTILRLAGKLRAIVVVNAVYALATCAAVWVGAAHGLTGVAAGWFLGALAGTCTAVVAARDSRAQHEDIRGGGYAPREHRGRSRRTLPPVNPFEPGRDRVSPGAVNGGYGPPGRSGSPGPQRPPRPVYPGEPGYGRGDQGRVGDGYRGTPEQPRRTLPPVNPFEPGRDRVSPGPVNGGYGPPGRSGNSEPPRPRRPVYPGEPGYGRGDHGRADEYPDPGPVNGWHGGRGNNGEPQRRQRQVIPDESAGNHAKFNEEHSHWD